MASELTETCQTLEKWKRNMPIYEAVAFRHTDLRKPLGVLFDPPCKSRLEDLKAWNNILPELLKFQEKRKKHICLLIQARTSRNWSRREGNYIFKPAEDYLIAAYIVDESFGSPWRPGKLTKIWLEKQERDAMKPAMISNNKIQSNALFSNQSHNNQTYNNQPQNFDYAGPVTEIRQLQSAVQVFQCSKAGCKLSRIGIMVMIKNEEVNNKQKAEAVSMANFNFSDEFGWRGRFLGVY